MTLLPLLLATRAFVIVSPETTNDRAAAVALNHQLRVVLRANRAETFGVLSLRGFLTGKRSRHVKPRKEATRLLTDARRAYTELDVEGSIKLLEKALVKAKEGLASSKGTSTWLTIQLELGLRLWENDDPRGVKLVAHTLALAPALKFPAGTQLSEEMRATIDKMRSATAKDAQVKFASDSPMLIQVAERACVSPCTLTGVPKGLVPWRATAPGFATVAGISETDSVTKVTMTKVPKREALLARLAPLWTIDRSEANLLLAEQRKTFPAPQFLWLRVGKGRLALLRGQVVPKAALHVRESRDMDGAISDKDLLAWIKASLTDEATVGPPVRARGLMHTLGVLWSSGVAKIPSIGLPSMPSKKTLVISGATLAGTAAIAGLAYVLSQQPVASRGYDPVLGF